MNTAPLPSTTKVQVKFIIIDRAEGPKDKCGLRTCASFAEANAYLKSICDEHDPKRGGADKCDFRLQYADGEEYLGHYGVAHPHSRSHEKPDLGAHARFHLEFNAGLNKPKHLTDDEYDTFRQRRLAENPTAEQDAIRWLKTYALADAPAAAAPAPEEAAATPGLDIATKVAIQQAVRVVTILDNEIAAGKAAGKSYAALHQRMMNARKAVHFLTESNKP